MKEEEKLKLAEQNKHISTAEIRQDISDTLVEIAQMEREAEHLEATPMGMRDARWNHIRASGRHSGIEERRRFVERLEAILEVREEKIEETKK